MDAIAKTNLGSSENMQLFQNTTDLYKAEDFIRKFFIPLAICEYKLAIGELEDEGDNVTDMYLEIQENVNDNEGTSLKTKETKFSFEDAKKLYNFLAAAFDAGLEAFKAEFMTLPRRQQDMYNFRDRKKREHKGQPLSEEKMQALVDQAGYFRIPNFLFLLRSKTNEDKTNEDAMSKCAEHFHRYFQVFRCRNTCHVAFNFESQLRIGVHLLALNIDYDISVITLLKEHSVAVERAVDFRSAVETADGEHAHLFGIGSYITHGCGRHTNVSFPNFRVGCYAAAKKKSPDNRTPYPQILRAFYSRRFFVGTGVNPQCELPSCFE
jgi:hypothetical protein